MLIDDDRPLSFSYDSWFSSTQPLTKLQKYCWVRIDDVPVEQQLVEGVLARLGSLQPQYNDIICWDVVPKCPGYGSSLGDRGIDLHTELAEFPEPPRYVALYCVRPARTGGALKLLDLRPLIGRLPTSLIETLQREPVTVYCEDKIAKQYGLHSFTAPTLSRRADGPLVRYDPLSVEGTMPHALREFMDLIGEYAREHAIELLQTAGSLVIWDNWCVIHGRTGFDDADRHLWRYCIKASPATA